MLVSFIFAYDDINATISPQTLTKWLKTKLSSSLKTWKGKVIGAYTSLAESIFLYDVFEQKTIFEADMPKYNGTRTYIETCRQLKNGTIAITCMNGGLHFYNPIAGSLFSIDTTLKHENANVLELSNGKIAVGFLSRIQIYDTSFSLVDEMHIPCVNFIELNDKRLAGFSGKSVYIISEDLEEHFLLLEVQDLWVIRHLYEIEPNIILLSGRCYNDEVSSEAYILYDLKTSTKTFVNEPWQATVKARDTHYAIRGESWFDVKTSKKISNASLPRNANVVVEIEPNVLAWQSNSEIVLFNMKEERLVAKYKVDMYVQAFLLE
jgi:hypothetical protein